MKRLTWDDWYEPEPMSGCFLWVGAVNQAGYGQKQHAGKVRLAHRIAFEMAKGPIPDGLVIDHKCGVRCCVNPDHLQATTFGRNIWFAFNRDGRPTKPRRKFCSKGLHRMEGENVIDRNGRTCRECKRAGAAEYWKTYRRKK